MLTADQALLTIPDGLRKPLIDEYTNIIQNYMEHKWRPSELSGGRFCEVVYTILEGSLTGTYASTPSKPRNFLAACRALESNPSCPRSFQILIPRMLTALYEIRNNRGVGHTGGDVDPNHMDSAAVVNIASWIMGELIRVFHNVSTQEAQNLADRLVEARTPLIWTHGDIRRVLKLGLGLREQIVLLLLSTPGTVSTKDLLLWIEYKNHPYFYRLLRKMHSERFIELSKQDTEVELLPPGAIFASQTIAKSTQ